LPVLLLVLAVTLFIDLALAEDLLAEDLLAEDLLVEDLLVEDLLVEDLLAGDLEFVLRRADVEREVIVSGTCVQPERTAKFKRALIGIGESAPIRDK
jgi:hypothetical protein